MSRRRNKKKKNLGFHFKVEKQEQQEDSMEQDTTTFVIEWLKTQKDPKSAQDIKTAAEDNNVILVNWSDRLYGLITQNLISRTKIPNPNTSSWIWGYTSRVVYEENDIISVNNNPADLGITWTTLSYENKVKITMDVLNSLPTGEGDSREFDKALTEKLQDQMGEYYRIPKKCGSNWLPLLCGEWGGTAYSNEVLLTRIKKDNTGYNTKNPGGTRKVFHYSVIFEPSIQQLKLNFPSTKKATHVNVIEDTLAEEKEMKQEQVKELKEEAPTDFWSTTKELVKTIRDLPKTLNGVTTPKEEETVIHIFETLKSYLETSQAKVMTGINYRRQLEDIAKKEAEWDETLNTWGSK